VECLKRTYGPGRRYPVFIHLIVIGKVKELYLRDGIEEFLKRLSGFCTVRITEFSEERVRDNKNTAESLYACQQEGKNLLKCAGCARLLISLDPHGIQMNSEAFAELLKKYEIEGSNQIAFLIGGPHGLSDEVRLHSDHLISLSQMTFPHQLVRLILLEQIYRAFTINKGLPYHR
jgi:23S rRNA (pseudouridine1915-N3)-methyltransferase